MISIPLVFSRQTMSKPSCALLCLILSANLMGAGDAVFLQPPNLIGFDGATTHAILDLAAGKSAAPAAHAYWGKAAGMLLITADNGARHGDDDLEDHSHDNAAPLLLLSTDGGRTQTIFEEPVLRAFPSPDGSRAAIITPNRDLILWEAADNRLTTASLDGRVSHGAWSPDSNVFAAAVYPPDFSPHKLDNPKTAADFLRLQNSDIVLFDGATAKPLRTLTSDPGTDYNPFFSPDGSHLYYVWLHLRESAAALMRVDVTDTASTPALESVLPLGSAPGEIPIGRVATYVWTDPGSLVFEPGLPDGSGEIWTLSLAAKAARKLGDGRKPQLLNDGSVAFLGTDGAAKRIAKEAIVKGVQP